MGNPSSRLWLIAGGVILCAMIITAIVLAIIMNSQDDVIPAAELLKQVPLIDGHNDLANNLYEIEDNQLNNFNFDSDFRNSKTWNCSYCMTDMRRLREGQIGAQFWAAYVSCDTQCKDAVERTLEQIDVIKRLVQKYSDYMQFVTTADGIMDAFNKKKIGSLIGVEGGHSIDSRLAVLRLMYELGVRYMTLTHTCNTPWAGASPTDNNTDPLAVGTKGLTKFGQTVVLEMNRLGMMVDLSHVSYATMKDALEVSLAPVIFSHSSAYTLCNHHRNVRDDILKLVGEKRGIVMVNFYSNFVQCNSSKNATLDDVVAHINHIRDIAGVDHIGIGGDYDGTNKMPIGLEDVSKYPDLFDRLAENRPGEPAWDKDDLKNLAGLNLIRVFKEVEKVRDNLAKTPPYETVLPRSEAECDAS